MSNCCGEKVKIIQVPADFTGLTPADCVTIFQCILDNGTQAQFEALCAAFGVMLNVSTGPDNIIANATSTAGVECTENLHLFSPDNSVLISVTEGSAIAGFQVNPALLTGLAHTSITGIDLQPTANPNEFTVAISWVDSDGNPQTTTDPTPITVTSADTSGTVEVATAAFTTSNGVNVAIGGEYIEFPNGDTWANAVGAAAQISTEAANILIPGDDGGLYAMPFAGETCYNELAAATFADQIDEVETDGAAVYDSASNNQVVATYTVTQDGNINQLQAFMGLVTVNGLGVFWGIRNTSSGVTRFSNTLNPSAQQPNIDTFNFATPLAVVAGDVVEMFFVDNNANDWELYATSNLTDGVEWAGISAGEANNPQIRLSGETIVGMHKISAFTDGETTKLLDFSLPTPQEVATIPATWQLATHPECVPHVSGEAGNLMILGDDGLLYSMPLVDEQCFETDTPVAGTYERGIYPSRYQGINLPQGSAVTSAFLGGSQFAFPQLAEISAEANIEISHIDLLVNNTTNGDLNVNYTGGSSGLPSVGPFVAVPGVSVVRIQFPDGTNVPNSGATNHRPVLDAGLEYYIDSADDPTPQGWVLRSGVPLENQKRIVADVVFKAPFYEKEYLRTYSDGETTKIIQIVDGDPVEVTSIPAGWTPCDDPELLRSECYESVNGTVDVEDIVLDSLEATGGTAINWSGNRLFFTPTEDMQLQAIEAVVSDSTPGSSTILLRESALNATGQLFTTSEAISATPERVRFDFTTEAGIVNMVAGTQYEFISQGSNVSYESGTGAIDPRLSVQSGETQDVAIRLIARVQAPNKEEQIVRTYSDGRRIATNQSTLATLDVGLGVPVDWMRCPDFDPSILISDQLFNAIEIGVDGKLYVPESETSEPASTKITNGDWASARSGDYGNYTGSLVSFNGGLPWLTSVNGGNPIVGADNGGDVLFQPSSDPANPSTDRIRFETPGTYEIDLGIWYNGATGLGGPGTGSIDLVTNNGTKLTGTLVEFDSSEPAQFWSAHLMYEATVGADSIRLDLSGAVANDSGFVIEQLTVKVKKVS